MEVLEGSLSIQLGGEHRGLTKGESVAVPRRTLHPVSNTHQGPTRFLLQVRPARRMEAAMRAVFAVAGVLGVSATAQVREFDLQDHNLICPSA